MRRAAAAAALALALPGCVAVAPLPLGSRTVTQTAPAAVGVPAVYQYLYGSAEAAALSEQAYSAMTRYVLGVMAGPANRREQAVLGPGATADRSTPLACGTLPPAVVLDMDETAVLNLGYEYDEASRARSYDATRWDAWERTGADKVVSVPGAARAFDRLRQRLVAIVINSNRSAANAEATSRALANAGLGSFRHGETLFLRGDVDGKSGKDGRRAAIAARYCVVAMAGDQLGDFADFFNPPGQAPAAGRRAFASVPGVADRWGNGWFLLPNPVYGTGLGSGWDETFPAGRRWADPGQPR